ncbi:MAG: glycosyltransferase family 39 protein [bacterium]
MPRRTPPRAARQPPKSARPGLAPWLEWVFTALGLCLMAVAGLANSRDEFLFAAHHGLYLRFPWMPDRIYHFFPMWYVTFGVPLALLAVALAFRPVRQALARPWRDPRLGVPLAAAVFVLTLSLLPWEHVRTPVWETGSKMTLYLLLSGAGLALFLAGFYRRLRFLDRPMEQAFDRLMALSRPRFILVLFGFTFILANLISFFTFEHLPHIQDSIAQLFQARIFARGRLFLDSPRFAEFFDYTHIINNGRWYSQYPFLHSLLMVPFVFVGAPWLLNPLLGALTVPVIYLLGRELYGERTGRLAGVLACITPFIFNMSAEYMNGASALLFATLFALFYFRTLREGRPRQALLAGLCLGLVANVRPYTALAVALPFAVHGLIRLVREPRRLLPRFLLMAAAGGALTSLVFVYNKLTNGDWLTFGYVVKWGKGHELGFGRSGWGEAHTPLRGLIHTGNNLNLLNKYLYEWPLAALVPVLIPLAAGTRRAEDRLMLAWPASLLVAHFFYWFHNCCFGPRFLYEAVPGLILLTVRGAEELGPFLRRTFGLGVTDAAARHFVGRAWPVLTLVAVVAGLPPLQRVYHRYADVDAQTVKAVRRAGLTNALVFLDHLGHGFTANDLDLSGDIVYAKDLGPLNPALTLSYPDRRYYQATGNVIRSLGGLRCDGSQLETALGEMARFLDDSTTLDYRTVIWPFAEIRPGVGWLERGDGPPVENYREVSRRIFNGSARLDDYLPALACWLVGDKREHLTILAFMDDLRNFVAAGHRFTLLYVTSEGSGAVYEITPLAGDEVLVPEGPGFTPVR